MCRISSVPTCQQCRSAQSEVHKERFTEYAVEGLDCTNPRPAHLWDELLHRPKSASDLTDACVSMGANPHSHVPTNWMPSQKSKSGLVGKDILWMLNIQQTHIDGRPTKVQIMPPFNTLLQLLHNITEWHSHSVNPHTFPPQCGSALTVWGYCVTVTGVSLRNFKGSQAAAQVPSRKTNESRWDYADPVSPRRRHHLSCHRCRTMRKSNDEAGFYHPHQSADFNIWTADLTNLPF